MAKSGQITVTTAGTEVQGPDCVGGEFFLKAHPDNTDTVWVGESAGAVTSSTGFPLDAGESVVVKVGNLIDLWFDSDVNGEKICWLRVW
jgi:hypothetical protein